MTNNNVQEWFDAIAIDKKGVLEALRKIILSQGSEVVEEIKWSRPCYSINGKLFCYLYVAKNYVTLGFEKGASLDDPSKLLKGTGKEMRHVTFKTLDEVNKPEINRLIEEAFNK